MANNFPPFYGFPPPFPLPPHPQQPPSNAQSDTEQPSHTQHVPPPNAFPPMPGLQAGSLPGINLISHNMNGQSPQSPLPGLPSQPPLFPNAFLPFLQNGSLPLPPFTLPGFPFQPPAIPQTPPMNAPPARFPPQVVTQPGPATEEPRVIEMTDSAKDEGELSERDGRPQASNGSVYHLSQSQPTHTAPQHQVDVYNPDNPSAGQQVPQKSPRHSSQASKNPVAKLQTDREEARQFIKLLNSNNIGYRTLAKENLDNELLRGIYQSLNLPSEPAPIAPQKPVSVTPAAANTSNQTNRQQTSMPSLDTVTKPVAPVKTTAVPSPTTTGDRKDYVARLQAARLATQANAAKSSPQQSQATVTASPAGTTPAAKQPVTDEQRARNTELIKQRLEAMKAKQKPQAPDSDNAGSSVATTQPSSQTDTATMNLQRPAPPSTPREELSFPGIPGLFMANNSTTVAKFPPDGSKFAIPTVQQRREQPDSTTNSTPRGSVTPYTRPLGQSPRTDHDESMIIEVSDDESAGSEMDIDDDQTLPNNAAAPSGFHNDQASAAHSRSASAKPAATSTMSTPGPQTPATSARERELEDKEKQLAAMRLTLKRKLAEKREKDKAAAAAAAAFVASPAVVQTDTPIALDTSGNTKQLRRAEIQSKIPSLDAEIAINSKRISELTKEMNSLMAHNERIAKDKEQLTLELESLGIDTEGMSHAELRATKQAIDPPTQVESVRSTNGHIPAALPDEVSAPQHQPSELRNVNASSDEGQRSHGQILQPAQPSTPYAALPGIAHASSTLRGHGALMTTTQEDPLTKTRTAGAPSDTANTQSASVQDVDTPLDEVDFYSPPPPVEAAADAEMVTGQDTRAKDAHVTTAISPSEEGEIEMSESEEEYEPGDMEQDALDSTSARIDGVDSIAVSQVSAADEDEEEDYEPPDVDDTFSHEEPPAILHAAEADGGAMDIATSSDEDSSDDDSEDGELSDESSSKSGDEDAEDGHPKQAAPNPTKPTHSMPQPDINLADDLVPALQADTNLSVIETADDSMEEVQPPKFTPYESPLRYFKSYRYHPTYSQDIAGGFLSWTFSHNIDPEKPLCQFEVGGSCNDQSCPYQHFRDFGITGEKLLVQLGTANPGKTPEEKQKWNDGLRGVLKELRQKNIKEPNGIAAEIAKYRREFLGDDTRVVNL